MGTMIGRCPYFLAYHGSMANALIWPAADNAAAGLLASPEKLSTHFKESHGRHVCDLPEPEAEPEQLLDVVPAPTRIKLIFLDVDGPILPFMKDGSQQQWTANDNFASTPYAENIFALKRIIHNSGGPNVVKVVLSSSWRIHPDQTSWLEAQFQQHGIEMVGHTDQVTVNPNASEELMRTMEIQRAVNSRIIGKGGPRFIEEEGRISFRRLSPPDDWVIAAWIAIDDLCLSNILTQEWDDIVDYFAHI